MKLERVTLANFRGYDQIDLQFEADVTVIAGVNGVGKSALLGAIVKAMSLVLPHITPSQEKVIGLADTDVKSGKDNLALSILLNTSKANIYVDIARSAAISAARAEELTIRRDKLRFATRETKKRSKEEQEIKDEISRIEIQLASVEDVPTVRILPKESHTSQSPIVDTLETEGAQPIAVFYSTSRFLSRLPPSLKAKAIKIATAYDKALDQLEVSLNDFANWYRVLAEENQSTRVARMFQQLEAAIATFLPDVSSLSLHSERPPRFSVQKNGSTFFLEQLSDGECGLLALVFDLTRRLAIANPVSDNPIADGVALVMIDEIELHLHPKWQRQVVRRLRDVFKNCQFVITTHSPQVIGQVNAKKLRLLSHDNAGKVILTEVSQAFGMDSSWVLQNIMGVPARDYETEQELSKVFDAIDKGQYEAARALAERMKVAIGDFPDLQEAFAILDRFELLELR
ncbi:MAG: AAA family ATPase [Methylobacter sp.]|jgi:predicted ATP-binding protein involved in virulence|uniref:AAA family ATPase n=1 Tax=Methylobacter sp. TaxID=2051955 RepID=UPI0025D07EBC|nr:AAA family ATPase [Methylobacter sp.]MCK9620263.1 AAA family ATPase [Methylobacter sp.]